MKNGESPVNHDRTLLNHGWSSWGLRGPHPSQAATYAENCQGVSRLVSEAVSSYQNICCNCITAAIFTTVLIDFHLCLCCPVLQWVGLRKWPAIKWNCEAADLKFFCNAGTGFCDCGAACRVFPILFFNSGTMSTADNITWVSFLQFITFQPTRLLPPCWMICRLVDAKGWQLLAVGALAKYKQPIVPWFNFNFSLEGWVDWEFQRKSWSASKLPYLMKIQCCKPE